MPSLLDQAINAHRSGDLSTAESGYRALLAESSTTRADQAEARHLLGMLCGQSGRAVEGIALLRQAIAQATPLPRSTEPPLLAKAWHNLGNLLRQQGAAAEAAQAFRSALNLAPTLLPSLTALAPLLVELGETEAAIQCYRDWLCQQPEAHAAQLALALLLHQRQQEGDTDAARAAYAAAAQDPALYRDAQFNLGVLEQDAGHLDAAIAAYGAVVQAAPELVAAHYNLGVALQARQAPGDAEAALAAYAETLARQPDHVAATYNRGVVFDSLGQTAAAASCYQHTLRLAPGHVDATYNLGNACLASDDCSAAVRHYQQLLAKQPEHYGARLNLAVAQRQQGELTAAAASYRQLLTQTLSAQQRSAVQSNLLFCLAHDETVDIATLADAHRQYGDFAAAVSPPWPDFAQRDRHPTRRLRLGLLSADWRQHPVCEYVAAVITALPAAEFELFFYANQPATQADSLTARLQTLGHWRPVATLDDAALGQQIKHDQIDLLLELSGHTSGNRLLALASKPAPVQATWVGYFGSTGLATIDYVIGDAALFPPAVVTHYREKLLRLPAAYAFTPAANAPAITPLPSLERPDFTFGSFNRPSKIGPAVIARWAQVLQAVPASRLLLGAIPASQSARLQAAFAQHGIAPTRLHFLPVQNLADYLAGHAAIDLLLDCAPFAGGATSHHAAWMGVPILTLPGTTALSRQGSALMQALDLPEFIAGDEADFTAKAVWWSSHHDELARVRAGLRERCRRAAPFDAPRIAAALTLGLRQAWLRWCADQPAIDLTVESP